MSPTSTAGRCRAARRFASAWFAAALLASLGAPGVALAHGDDTASPFHVTFTSVSPTDGLNHGVLLLPDDRHATFTLASMGGRSALVYGYGADPYVRLDADGTVWVNRMTPTAYANDPALGAAPADASYGAAPEWLKVASDNRFTWHDHRIHFVGAVPPDVAAGQPVQAWTVRMDVDGSPVTVQGDLVWDPAVPLGDYEAGLPGVSGIPQDTASHTAHSPAHDGSSDATGMSPLGWAGIVAAVAAAAAAAAVLVARTRRPRTGPGPSSIPDADQPASAHAGELSPSPVPADRPDDVGDDTSDG